VCALTVHPAAERLRAALEAGRPLVLLFDFDGTLAPYADHPRNARLPAATRRVLERLAAHRDVFLGFVSGRSLDDLRAQVGLRGVYYAGTSGLEMDMIGIRVSHPDEEQGRQLIDAVHPRLEGLCAGYPRTWVERKPLALTLHYRHLANALEEGLRRMVRKATSPFGASLKVVECARAFEVVPALGWTKALAVKAIAEDAARDPLVLYAGDEANDADALAAVANLGGIAVGVGPKAPKAAAYRVDDPEQLADLLADVLHTPQRSRSIPG
jgi:trehalose-phosphatase